MKKTVVKEKFSWLSIIITLGLALLIYYFALPALNPSSIGFWVYIMVVLGIFALANLATKLDMKGNLIGSATLFKVIGASIFLGFLGIIIVNFVLSPLFNSKRYSNRIEVNSGNDFYEDIEQVDFSKVPLLDKTSSQKLGDRVMGQMS